MKKTKVKIPAKVNLTLDIIGTNGGYHLLNSLVTSIDVYDTVIVSPRKDECVTVKVKGISAECEMRDNVAFKTAKLFMEKTGASGVDIVIEKTIPVGAGLGGSSADIAGVLKAMKSLFLSDTDILQLANDLGSDSGYMLNGGYAVMKGRGNEITRYDVDKIFYYLIITGESKVSTKDSYNKFDQMGYSQPPCTESALTALMNDDQETFGKVVKNDLYPASLFFVPQMEEDISALKNSGAVISQMTGSGSSVYGVFTDERLRDKAYKKLKDRYGNRLIKAQTV